MSLLNSSFGLPSFFFGGKMVAKSSNPLPFLTKLPHFLSFLIMRKRRGSGKEACLSLLNNVTLSCCMEMDMGKFLDPKSPKPEMAHHGYLSLSLTLTF
jgi:hypothetical protein